MLRNYYKSRRREAGLGAYPDVPLAKARDYAREARDMLRDGIDPIAALQAKRRRALTFREAMACFEKEKTVEFRSEIHRK
ncbi:MAG: Arm DNA-binding domain-containing protein [Pseudomonadota bacterium]